MLTRDEKLSSIVREPSTHKRKASMRLSWDAHSSNNGTHDLKGAWGATLEALGVVWGKPALYKHGSLGQQFS